MEIKNLKYEMIIYWSKEDDVFIAEIPELKGCIAHGDTREEAMENVLQVAEAWMELAEENNWTIPEPHGRLVPTF